MDIELFDRQYIMDDDYESSDDFDNTIFIYDESDLDHSDASDEKTILD